NQPVGIDNVISIRSLYEDVEIKCLISEVIGKTGNTFGMRISNNHSVFGIDSSIAMHIQVLDIPGLRTAASIVCYPRFKHIAAIRLLIKVFVLIVTQPSVSVKHTDRLVELG